MEKTYVNTIEYQSFVWQQTFLEQTAQRPRKAVCDFFVKAFLFACVVSLVGGFCRVAARINTFARLLNLNQLLSYSPAFLQTCNHLIKPVIFSPTLSQRLHIAALRYGNALLARHSIGGTAPFRGQNQAFLRRNQAFLHWSIARLQWLQWLQWLRLWEQWLQ